MADDCASPNMALSIVLGVALGLALVLLASRCGWVRRTARHDHDVFLSYRVASDALLAEKIYHLLLARGLRVWFDKKSLLWGQRWEQGFVDGLLSSLVVVPVLSRDGLAPFATLTAEGRPDNVLLEHTLALEFKERSLVWGLTPLLVGGSPPPVLLETSLELSRKRSRERDSRRNSEAGAERSMIKRAASSARALAERRKSSTPSLTLASPDTPSRHSKWREPPLAEVSRERSRGRHHLGLVHRASSVSYTHLTLPTILLV